MLCYAAVICTPRYDCINIDIFDVDAIFFLSVVNLKCAICPKGLRERSEQAESKLNGTVPGLGPEPAAVL